MKIFKKLCNRINEYISAALIYCKILKGKEPFAAIESPCPIEKRDKEIERISNFLYEQCHQSWEDIITSEDFEKFFNTMGKIAFKSSENWDKEKILNALRHACDYQAEQLWVMSSVLGIQTLSNEDAKLYFLTYKDYSEKVTTSSEGNTHRAVGLTLEVVQKELEENGHIFSYQYTDFLRYYEMPLVQNVSKQLTDYVSNTIAFAIISKLMDLAEDNEKVDINDNIAVRLNISSNDIARRTRRGCGNYLIVDSKDAYKLYYKLSKELPKLPDHAKANKVPTSKSELYDDIYQHDHFKYEFTINGIIKVFSSSIFNSIAKQRGNGINAILGYCRKSVDCPASLGIDRLFNWETDDSFNFEAYVMARDIPIKDENDYKSHLIQNKDFKSAYSIFNEIHLENIPEDEDNTVEYSKSKNYLIGLNIKYEE
jgi:hypothetical protein